MTRMINNLWPPSHEEAPIDMYYDKSDAFLAAIVAATTKAKTAPFVVVSTLRTQAKDIHKHCKAACPDINQGVYHIFIHSRANDLPIHKEEVEKSIIDKFRALSGCSNPLVLPLFNQKANADCSAKRPEVHHS